jgi:hypothetical protein
MPVVAIPLYLQKAIQIKQALQGMSIVPQSETMERGLG